MALLDLWQTNPEVRAKRVDQVMAIAGDGRLRDGNETFAEFRALLAAVPSDVLHAYSDQCLAAERFEDRGLALQDLVNEAGAAFGLRRRTGTVPEAARECWPRRPLASAGSYPGG